MFPLKSHSVQPNMDKISYFLRLPWRKYSNFIQSNSFKMNISRDIFMRNEIRGVLKKNPHIFVLQRFRPPFQNPPNILLAFVGSNRGEFNKSVVLHGQ